MSSKHEVIELKDCGNSFRLKLTDIRTLWDLALDMQKDPSFWLYFNSGEFVVKCIVEKP